MNRQQEIVYELLNKLNVEYQAIEHPAVFTAEEGNSLNICHYGDMCKNLFLRDARGKRYFLVVLYKDKQADLKSIQEQLGCTRLGFASEERLFKHLHLQKGSVTPLGIINDSEALVEVVLDNDLIGKEKLGVHPNVNTATVWLSFNDLKRIIEQNGNIIHFVKV